MCDYSIVNAVSRPAKVGDKLVTRNFGYGTVGFADVNDRDCAVCLTPGTEIAFDAVPNIEQPGLFIARQSAAPAAVAIFRQVNKDQERTHHDTLEFPDGSQVLLTGLIAGQTASVLQLPAAPRTAAEVEEQTRAPAVG